MRRNVTTLCLCAVAALFGCAEKGKPTTNPSDKTISKAAPQKVIPTSPSGVQPTNQPSSRPTGSKTKLPPGHPPTNGPTTKAPALNKGKATPTSRPTSAPTSRPTSAPAGGGIGAPGIIKGRIDITEELRSKLKPGTTLFISVRRFAGEGKKGMIMAAKKYPVGNASIFPLNFTVTQRDVMMGGTKLVGPVSVTARVDQDGDAISKQAGDIEGAHKGSIMVGKDSASIMLNVLRQ